MTINKSYVVQASDFRQPWFVDRAKELATNVRLHRKLWEFCVIAQVYHERIGNSGKALGFGVGKEPIASWLASRGCQVLATDLPNDSTGEWLETNQYASELGDIFFNDICDKDEFDRLVKFRPVDMNHIPTDLYGKFDFVWSAGSFEHIGGIDASLEFFVNQMKCLSPKGVAVHVTEFNFASDTVTINAPNLVLFRKRDLLRLEQILDSAGFRLLDLNFDLGNSDEDNYVDHAPYREDLHLKLEICGQKTTSIVLIAERQKPAVKVMSSVSVSVSEQPINVLWCGDSPTIPTGFAMCTRAVCDELHSQGHKVTVLGINEWGGPNDYPYDIYPSVTPLEKCSQWDGSDRLPRLIHKLSPDVVVLLNDPWNVSGYLQNLELYNRQLEREGRDRLPNVPIVGWMAVDGKNQQHAVVLNNLAHVVVWTKFGAEELKLGGYKGEPSIVPLGVDSNVFYPMSQAEARSKIIPEIIPCNAFIVGVVGRNQPRKRLDLTIEYFAKWIHDYHIDNAYLYLHVAPTGECGTDIIGLSKYFGLKDRVMLPRLQVGKGHDENGMRHTYNSLDVLLSTSQGEGWGLPVIEAMACGVPCIVPDWSALGAQGGWTGCAVEHVPCFTTAPTAPLHALAYTLGGIADRDAAVEALNGLYRSAERRANLSRKGLKLASTLTWKQTGQMMVEVLQSVVTQHESNASIVGV